MAPAADTRDTSVLDLPDGRTLAYVDGHPDGRPVLFQHGTGDSRLARHPDESIARDAGARLITVDRPGVGGSTPRRGRALLDWADDVAALADHLGVERFAMAGWSGGGPHALAVACALGERVGKVTLASPLGPFDRPGSRDLVENKDLRMIWRLSHFKVIARLAGWAESKGALRDMRGFISELASELPADERILLDRELEPMFEEEMAEALRQAGAGVLDDMWAFLEWGFRPEDIVQPVRMFLGDADDILSPEMYRDLARRLPDCAVDEWAGGGHYALFGRERWAELMASSAS